MKKLSIVILSVLFTLNSFAQDLNYGTNSTDGKVITNLEQVSPKPDPKPNPKFTDEYTIDTRNVYRGISLGGSPAVGVKFSYNTCNWFTLKTNGVFVPGILDGKVLINTYSYGSYLENTMVFKKNKFNLEISDMFFFIGDDLYDNDYFSYKKEDTRHLVNAAVRYTDGKFYGLVQTSLYKADTDTTDGIYFETGYKVNNRLTLNAGYVTDASTMNFRTKEGITHIGFTTTTDLKINCCFTPKLTTSLYLNPTYKSVVLSKFGGVSQSPIQFAIGLSF